VFLVWGWGVFGFVVGCGWLFSGNLVREISCGGTSVSIIDYSYRGGSWPNARETRAVEKRDQDSGRAAPTGEQGEQPDYFTKDEVKKQTAKRAGKKHTHKPAKHTGKTTNRTTMAEKTDGEKTAAPAESGHDAASNSNPHSKKGHRLRESAALSPTTTPIQRKKNGRRE